MIWWYLGFYLFAGSVYTILSMDWRDHWAVVIFTFLTSWVLWLPFAVAEVFISHQRRRKRK